MVVADVLETTLDRRPLVVLLLAMLGPEDVEVRSKDALLLVAEVVFAPGLGFENDDLNADPLFSSVLADIEEVFRSCPDMIPVVVRLVLADNSGLVGGLLRLLPCVCWVLAVETVREALEEATVDALEVIGALVNVDFVLVRGRLAVLEVEFVLRSVALLPFTSVVVFGFVRLEDCFKSACALITSAHSLILSAEISSLSEFS